MNILITGGLGYIGGRLAAHLKEKEPNNTVFISTKNQSKIIPAWAKSFPILFMDVCDEESIDKCLEGKKIDAIIHLGAVNEIESLDDPELALEVNTKGTYRLLKSAKQHKINRFIYFSTFHVYGKTKENFITEETPTRPIHPYAITHRAAEDFVTYFNHYHGMKTLILRISNGYGYPMDIGVNRWSLVFNDLCRQSVTNQKIILKSSGKQKRDFIALHDIARVVYHFLFVIPENWMDGLFNIGGNYSMSILEVAEKINNVYYRKYCKRLSIKKGNEDNQGKDFTASLTYSIDKLLSTSFKLEANMDTEIEKTMQLCEEFNNELSR